MSVKNRLNDLDQRIARLCVKRMSVLEEYLELGKEVERFEAQRKELEAQCAG